MLMYNMKFCIKYATTLFNNIILNEIKKDNIQLNYILII